MAERDLVSEFNTIVEQYKTSPFGFRLRKTGNVIKLAEHNGLFYIDPLNLYKVVNELLGPDIPEEMIEYIGKITFSEQITVEGQYNSENKEMTCIQFVDQAFFNKCSSWVNQKVESKSNEYGMLFNSFFTSNDPLSTLKFKDQKTETSDDMLSFQNFLLYDKVQNPATAKKILEETPYMRGNPSHRPRGKQMNMVSESLKDRPFICEVPFCDRAFKRFEHLKRHLKMHTGDKPFKCDHPNCYKTFSRSDNLHQHQKIHENRSQFSGSTGSIRFQNENSDLSSFRFED